MSRLSPQTLEIFLLGRFGARVGGAPVGDRAWARSSARQLVKLLSLSPSHRLHREHIIDLLWPEHDLETGTNNLNKAIHAARRALEPSLGKAAASAFIRTQQHHIALDAPGGLSVDVEEFQTLASAAIASDDAALGKKAVELYRGDLLIEDVYEEWLIAHREALRILYRKTAAKTAQLCAASDELPVAFDILRKLAVEDPSDEHVHRLLMRLYAESGSKYQALKQYELCERALEGLGLEIEPETRALGESIRRGSITTMARSAPFTRSKEYAGATGIAFRQLTFQRGSIQSARFAEDGRSVVYSAGWDGNKPELYLVDRSTGEPRSLGLADAVACAAVGGELLVALDRRFVRGYTSEGTLAVARPENGRVETLFEKVQWADLSPGADPQEISGAGEHVTVVRERHGQCCLEYPPGKVVYSTGGWISHPRFSRAGDMIAFAEHPTIGDDSGFVVAIEIGGKGGRQVLTETWISIQGLAWAGDEIWFTAAVRGNARALYCVRPGGEVRLLYRGIGSLTLHDVSAAGEVLLTVDKTRIQIAAGSAGGPGERDLSWHDWSLARDLTDDGRMLLFTEAGESGGADYATYIRGTDGSPPVKVGSGSALCLSPDQSTALVRTLPPGQRLALLPLGGGEVRPLIRPGSDPLYFQPWGCFSPDGRSVIFAANDVRRGTRLYMQELDGGPVCITPYLEGVELSSPHSIAPDGRRIAIIDSDHRVCVFGIETGICTPLSGLGSGFLVVRWSGDGQYIFVRPRGTVPAVVHRYDLETDRAEDWLTLMPSDPAGIYEILRVLLTPDGGTYAYSYTREFSDLYLIEGLPVG